MLRIGLVGVGFMGRMHANVYSLLDKANLVACVSKHEDSRTKFASDFGIKAYASMEEMIDAESLDAVDICLPTYLHRDFTVRALNAGVHVMCEKPMALTLEDADAMIAAADSSGKSLMIGHCIRFWPEYAALKQLVDAGSLGRLLSLNLTRFGAFPSWSAENWLANPALAGGGVLDMHIHDTDFAHYVLGSPETQSSWGTVDDRGASHVFTTMTYGKTIVHLEGGWNLPSSAPFKHAFRAIFERGMAMMDAGPLTIYEDGKEPVIPEFPKMNASGGGNISDLGGYFHELNYFVNKLSDGQPFEVVTPASSRASLATTLEEIRQVFERQPVLA